MNERYEYKANEIESSNYGYRHIINEYGTNLGSSRRQNNDIFDEALRLKHLRNPEKKS